MVLVVRIDDMVGRLSIMIDAARVQTKQDTVFMLPGEDVPDLFIVEALTSRGDALVERLPR